MAGTFDFERHWQERLKASLGRELVDGDAGAILQGGEALSDQSDRRAVIGWTACAMERLEATTTEAQGRAVMTGCACHYPGAQLAEVKTAYAANRDVDEVLDLLRAQFVSFLRTELALEETQVEDILAKGWGLAGRREGNRIIATKIPKSAYLREYLAEPDPARRRELYCHCPRVRAAIGLGASLPPAYCYCGAGFYQAMWEEILGEPVQVELLESVLSGGEVCRVAITLPSA